MQKRPQVPIFGICLGHQLLSLGFYEFFFKKKSLIYLLIAAGFKVEKLKYGNRGHNLPCNLVGTTKVFQTTQNHGYATMFENNDNWAPFFVNLNDNSNEGIIHKKNPWMSTQFHPEAKAGPLDTSILFHTFLNYKEDRTKSIFRQAYDDFAPLFAVPIKKRSRVLVLGSGGLCIGKP